MADYRNRPPVDAPRVFRCGLMLASLPIWTAVALCGYGLAVAFGVALPWR